MHSIRHWFDLISERAPRGLRAGQEVSRRRPAQLLAVGLATGIALGTVLLVLPIAGTEHSTTALEAFFTATSAICVTGLIVVDTATHWTAFGQVVILVLIQIGGLGVMTFASVLGLMIARHLGLQTRMMAATATRSVRLGEVRTILLGALRATVILELLTTLILALRWWLSYDIPIGRALWLGLFHAVSAFNNAGFALFSDNLVGYVDDPWINLPIALSLILGGLGFPVLLELYRHHHRRSRWSLQVITSITVTAVLIVAGTIFVTAAEWSNPDTLGRFDVPGRLLAGFFQAVSPRTAGFNTVDTSAMNTGTWLGTDLLMFIGGGSAGTAGGIKVTTLAVLAMAVRAELRGDQDVTAFRHRLSPTAVREALTVALLSAALVVIATNIIAMTSPFTLDEILYEVVSAFGTVGLSTGITAELVAPHQIMLCVLMFVGRIGPIVLGSALAMRNRGQSFRYPPQTMIIG